MAQTSTFSVAVFAVKPVEIGMLDRVLRLSQYRSRAYTMLKAEAGLAEADILIVDSIPPEALGTTPVAKIIERFSPEEGEDGRLANGFYVLERPLLPNRVLKVLDRITVEILDYAPELNIGDDAIREDIGIYKALKQHAEEEKTKAITGGLDFRKLKVLVVDDSSLVQKQMELILSGEGINADFASDGASALAMHRDKQYDLVFLDVVMPDMDGFQVCKTLCKASVDPPYVVMLTSKGSAINRVHGVLVGASAYLTKPATRSSLVKTIEQFMKKED